MSNNQWKCDENKAPWAVRGLDCSAKARVDGLVLAYAAKDTEQNHALVLAEVVRAAAR